MRSKEPALSPNRLLTYTSLPQRRCLAFFFPFAIYFVVALLRLQKYAFDREMFFCLLPLTLFLAIMVAALPTRAFAATNNSTGHVLAQHVMFAIAVPILVDVALQLYGLLRKRAIPSGWVDSTAICLRVINAVALILYAVAASELVTCTSVEVVTASQLK